MTPQEHGEVFARAAKVFRQLVYEQRGVPAEQYWTLMRLCEVLAYQYLHQEAPPNDEVH